MPDPHEYWHTDQNGNKTQYKGVTGLIGNYEPYFDKNAISKAVARRDKRTQEDVLAEWKKTNQESIVRGNYVHDCLEHFVKTGEVTDEPLIDGFVKSYEAMGLTPVAAEWTIYDESIQRASSVDGNFLDSNGNFVIVDYKTNKDGVKLKSYKDQRLVFPLQNLYASKHSVYSLQVSMYWYWIEKFYLNPQEISNAHWIVHIAQNKVTHAWEFEWIMALDLRKEIELIYNDFNAIHDYQSNISA